MIREVELYKATDQVPFKRSIIDAFAIPDGDHYGDDVYNDYLWHYSGYASKFKAQRIFEVGVRYGSTAIAMLLGAKEAGIKNPYYLGIDDESYHARSCDKANTNLKSIVPWADATAMKWNSITQEMPVGIGMFDLISVDGNHDSGPVLNDLEKCWPLLNEGGVVVLDDATIGCEVYHGIQRFLDRFRHTNAVIEYQHFQNLRNHVLLRKTST